MSRRKDHIRGFTLVELLIALSILAILGALAITGYAGQIKKAKVTLAISEIRAMSLDLSAYIADNGNAADSLDDVRHGKRKDPWGNPYQYLKIKGAAGVGGMRKDRFLVPLNSDFDLYSMGPDGKSKPPLTASVSMDDIIRANDGGYIGPAYAY